MPYPESGPCSDCAGEVPTSQDEIVVPLPLVEGMETGEGSGGYVTPPVENSDPIPLRVRIHTVLEKAAVRTMVFTPDFSLLFCLTHFTFVNFSYPYDTNLFSYLPFILSYAFTLTVHTRRRSKAVDWIHWVVVQRRRQNTTII